MEGTGACQEGAISLLTPEGARVNCALHLDFSLDGLRVMRVDCSGPVHVYTPAFHSWRKHFIV